MRPESLPSSCTLPSGARPGAGPAARVEVVELQGFLVDGVVGEARVDGEQHAGVVVHQVAPDLARAVGDAGRVGRVRRAQQQRGRVDGAADSTVTLAVKRLR